MKHRSVDETSALASGLLGLMGISILLIPDQVQTVVGNLPGWMIFTVGFLAFLVAFYCLLTFAFHTNLRREILIRASLISLSILLAGLLIHSHFLIEGSLLFFVGLTQAVPIVPIWKSRLQDKDILTGLSVVVNIFCGLILIFLNPNFQDSYTQILPYRLPVTSLFILTAAFGIFALFRPANKYNELIKRLATLPWLIWCVFFLSDTFSPTLTVPLLFACTILVAGVFPWDSLALPEGDILGKRAVMVASVIELAMLIFLSTLLALTSQSSVSIGSLTVLFREAAFGFYLLITVVLFYGVATILMTINGLITRLTASDDLHPADQDLDRRLIPWNQRLARYLKPFALTRDGLRIRLNAQADQLNVLTRQLSVEKRRNAQLTLLAELSQQLESELDQPVAAQLAVNTLERALDATLITLYIHEAQDREFMLLAASGQQTNLIPPGYRQDASKGLIGRAVRQRKTQIINNLKSDPDYIPFSNENNQSAVTVPLIFNGHVNGMIVISDEKPNAFSSIDVALAEAVAAELTRAWERSGYHRRLRELIQAGSRLSSMVEPEATARHISTIAKEILQARFAFVQIQLGQEGDFRQKANAGEAPRLLESLSRERAGDPLVQAAFNAAQPFRVRDVRKYLSTSHLEIDHGGLRSMLAIPIRWHGMGIGAILAFGKQNEVFFTENDEALAELLSIQAAGAFESVWLQQELRASLNTTSLLYRLSIQIIQAEDLKRAALNIARTARKLAQASATGIVLFTTDGNIEAEAEVDASGAHASNNHPVETIRQAMNSGQMIYLSQGHSLTRICLPIQTPIRKYGALWINIPENRNHKPISPADLQTLANQAAIALERSILFVERERQARVIKGAYDTLESTYDQTLAALMTALDARDQETEGHSLRVSQLAGKLGEAMKLPEGELKALERGSLLHDIGKIGISDNILHKPGPLTEEEWKMMRRHPDIGARIVDGIPFLEETKSLIRHHQERWDGTGYPSGLCGEEIPLLARLFSVVDAFDALTSNRPYREKVSAEEAVTYLRQQSGILFDPNIVEVFEQLVLDGQVEELLSSE